MLNHGFSTSRWCEYKLVDKGESQYSRYPCYSFVLLWISPFCLFSSLFLLSFSTFQSGEVSCPILHQFEKNFVFLHRSYSQNLHPKLLFSSHLLQNLGDDRRAKDDGWKCFHSQLQQTDSSINRSYIVGVKKISRYPPSNRSSVDHISWASRLDTQCIACT